MSLIVYTETNTRGYESVGIQSIKSKRSLRLLVQGVDSFLHHLWLLDDCKVTFSKLNSTFPDFDVLGNFAVSIVWRLQNLTPFA